MSLLASMGVVDAVLRGATGLVRELKRPKAAPEMAFSPTLQQELQRLRTGNGTTPSARAEQAARHFMDLRDVNGDGALSLQESGLEGKHFAHLDMDANGTLSLQEIQRQYTPDATAQGSPPWKG